MSETIKQDYFKLLRDLNKSNKIKDTSTNIFFYIEADSLYAALTKDQKVLLCESDRNEWYPSGHYLYPVLEERIANFLNKKLPVINLTVEIKLSIFQVLD